MAQAPKSLWQSLKPVAMMAAVVLGVGGALVLVALVVSLMVDSLVTALLIAVAIVVALALSAFLLMVVPGWDVGALGTTTADQHERAAKTVELRVASRASIAQAIGGVLLIATLAVAAYQANGARRAADDARQAATANLKLASEAQLTERFARSVEQLDSSSSEGGAQVDVRVGALFALQRIGEDSERDRQPALLTVATYVRNNVAHARRGPSSPAQQDACFSPRRLARRVNLRADMRVALSYVLPTLEKAWPRPGVGWSQGLQFTNFTGVNLGPLTLIGLNLEGSLFRDANLGHASFQRVFLRGASFRDACLYGADFSGPGSRFEKLDLRGADLRNAHVTRSFFSGATVDSRTNVDSIELDGERFDRTQLVRACHNSKPGVPLALCDAVNTRS